MSEQWRPVRGWEGLYEVSDAGSVRSIPRPWQHRRQDVPRILRFGSARGGYLTVTLSRPGERHAYTVHRLVAEAFIGPKPEGWHTCHRDGDKTNNAVANLSYGTPSENEHDKVRHGRNVNANKTECPQGHAYNDANTGRDSKGGRYCKACKAVRNRNDRARTIARRDALLIANGVST